jgi:hypothetical protein
VRLGPSETFGVTSRGSLSSPYFFGRHPRLGDTPNISERQKVLKILDEVNVNAYSLFGSEESLMETLAVRELFLNDVLK